MASSLRQEATFTRPAKVRVSTSMPKIGSGTSTHRIMLKLRGKNNHIKIV